MTTISDLSNDLIEEILCRVPITFLKAVRSTCKGWNALSKNRILCKSEAKHQFLGFTTMDHRLCSVRFNLQGILNEDGEEFVDPCLKPIGNILNQVEISKVFSCDGLLLCVTRNNSSGLVVWNPYLGQTRWIQPSYEFSAGATNALGYDNNKNYKILRFYGQPGFKEIYDLKSNSWRSYDGMPYTGLKCYQPGASLNGNAYFLTDARKVMVGYDCLFSFDFTTERFGLLSLPFSHEFNETGRLSCVKEEKLAALYQRYETSMIEIWMTTTKIEPDAMVSWSKFLKVFMEPLTGFQFDDDAGSFFIDEEKEVAVVFSLDESERNNMAYIIGDDRCLKEVDLEEVVNPQESVENAKVKRRRGTHKKKDKKRKRTNKV